MPTETPAIAQPTPSKAATTSPTNTAQTSTPQASATAEGPVVLRVWLPPQFDPQADTAAGGLLRSRLDEFSKRRPGVQVHVRLKAALGPGGLLDSLTSASAAAPQALPDLVALPRPLLETAALKGLLHPYTQLNESADSADWYPYAQQLARIQESIYGIPFAGDAWVLIYRPDPELAPPGNWKATLESNKVLSFPAADTQAFFTLALYQARGGQVRDEQGRPDLDAVALSDVLNFYNQAQEVGVMPVQLTQIASAEMVWELLLEGQTDMGAIWASIYLQHLEEDETLSNRFTLAPLPTSNGEPFTLASGWVWAQVASSADRQQLSTELAEFLSEGEFLGRWSQATGLLPPRPSALIAWPESATRSTLDQIMRSARLQPAADVMAAIASPIHQSVLQVLKDQNNPLNAAQEAANRLNSP